MLDLPLLVAILDILDAELYQMPSQYKILTILMENKDNQIFCIWSSSKLPTAKNELEELLN
jgi:hypothetical protein